MVANIDKRATTTDMSIMITVKLSLVYNRMLLARNGEKERQTSYINAIANPTCPRGNKSPIDSITCRISEVYVDVCDFERSR